VTEGFGDVLNEDLDVVPGAARAKGPQAREVTAHGRRGDARELADLSGVDRLSPLVGANSRRCVGRPAGARWSVRRVSSVEDAGSPCRQRYRSPLTTHWSTALRGGGHGVDERRTNGARFQVRSPAAVVPPGDVT
jgi:hypothetical protein